MASTRTGIVHQPYGQTTIEYLRLEHVRVNAWVVDVSSRIILTQTFYNPSDEPTGRAKYVFPLPANAAVCAFELEFDDGSVIVGEVKEQEETVQMFTQGKVEALVERVTGDMFIISVGAIPAATRVIAHLTFVMDLLNGALADHIRLQLPMHIAGRYGTSPVAIQDTLAADSRTRVHISIDIQTSDVIHGIYSPTHHIKHQCHGREPQQRMSVIWQSPEFLASDFIITIHAEGLDRPRCFAEVMEGSTVALQLTLVPNFLAPKIPSQEYIFVIDRSYSMVGAPIKTAKRTLNTLLHLLPSTQTTFNIFSFGGKAQYLWERSRTLDSPSLSEALSYVASMDADLPGTNVPLALEAAFGSRGLDRPAVVFLLTDGLIYSKGSNDLDSLSVIANALETSSVLAPTRLFVLGIGTRASSDTCSSLARQGNGEWLLAVSADAILGKCARLLNAARSRNIEHIHIDWGYDVSDLAASLSFSTPNLVATIPALEPPPMVQQAPHSLVKIFSGVRFTVFAIASFKTIPTFVRLFTKLDRDSDPQELIVPVTKVKPFRHLNEHSNIPMVHVMAARRLIMELNDGVGLLPAPVADDALLASEGDLWKAGIIRLGITYQLVSKHTSFVVVREGRERRRRRHCSMAWGGSCLSSDDDDLAKAPTFLDDLIDSASSLIASFFALFSNPAVSASLAPTTFDSHWPKLPGAYTDPDPDTSEPQGHRPRRAFALQRKHSSSSGQSTHTMSSLEGSFNSSCQSSSRSSSPYSSLSDPIERASSPEFLYDPDVDNTDTQQPIPEQVYNLFQQMDVDGSLTATPLLLQLVGDTVLGKADELGIDSKVWATVVFVAYITKRLQSEPDLVELLSEKAKEFVEATEWRRRFDEIVYEAGMALMSP